MSVRGDTSVESVASCTKPSVMCVNIWGPTLMKDLTTVSDATRDIRLRWFGFSPNYRCNSLLIQRLNMCFQVYFLTMCLCLAQNALQVNQRTHGDEKPYVCQFCLRGFREKGSLVRHIRHHTGEKPFKCTKCGRGFAEHGTLNRHMRAKGKGDGQTIKQNL